jgi:phytanoyl-CoA hydroxylase
VRTDPLSCNGLWVAFDDANQENGCMWAVPGSHRTEVPIKYFMRQKVELDKENNPIKQLYYDEPEEPIFDLSNSVPLEAKKGDVVLLDGSLVHYSHHNHSSKQRHAFTFHIVEGRNTKWVEDCWMQRPEEFPFWLMNEVKV